MNQFEKQALKLLRDNEPVDAALCLMEAAERYYADGNLRALSRTHRQLALVAEGISTTELADHSFYYAVLFAQRAAAKDSSQTLPYLYTSYAFSRFLARQGKYRDALLVIRHAVDLAFRELELYAQDAAKGCTANGDNAAAIADFSRSAIAFEQDLCKKQSA